MLRSLVGSEMCIRDRSRWLFPCLVAFASAALAAPFTPPRPSTRQLKSYDWLFSAFVHFGPTTFLPHSQDNNCATNSSTNITAPIAPASIFAPNRTDPIDTDQWVQTVQAMGATQLCFTAHHSGGFAMWPSNFKNYTIANSPYGRRFPGADLVRDFVNSCRKFGVSPCIYIAPEVDCDMAMLEQAEYFTRLKGMLGELLQDYGTIDRLWLDTVWTPFNNYPPHGGHGGSFGIAPWRDLFGWIERISPNTVSIPGYDGCEVNSDYGYGRYPYMTAGVLPPISIDARLPDRMMEPLIGENCWSIYGGNGVQNLSQIYSGPDQPTYFKVGEDMATIQRSGEWFLHPGDQPLAWSPQVLAGQYAATVLRGLHWILNIPAGDDGQLPAAYTAAAAALGTAQRGLNGTVLFARGFTDVSCPGQLELRTSELAYNAVFLAEDLASTGQVVANYTIQLDQAPALPPAQIPGPAFGEWNTRAGASIGFGVLDLLSRSSEHMMRSDTLTVHLTGCLGSRARLAIEVRRVELGPLARQ
eukprot:TRINITY_DN23132_c0_g2_i2.p1 TRINITY_DN23132_c0_g2~~TRINITY_DN23132_c0_g2_i2.p1  ORF type:complete len:527 (+),score=100.22 TRINITY_DN23132_c0_g2_i2:65-1645(+)